MINDNHPSHEQENAMGNSVISFSEPVHNENLQDDILVNTHSNTPHHDSGESQEPDEAQKERKFNGYLRNSNRKNRKTEHTHVSADNSDNPGNYQKEQNQEAQTIARPKTNVKNNKPKVKHTGAGRLKKEPRINQGRPHVHSNANLKTEEEFESSPVSSQVREDVFSTESQLFSFLRQKTGANPVYFWQLLQELLKEKEFNQIRKSDMSLVSYSALYEVNDVFENLLYEYGTQITQEEFETTVLPLCMSKDTLLLKHGIKFYNQHFQPQEAFIEHFVSKSCKISYREENNKIILQWLTPHMNEKHYGQFWQECLNNHNVIMLECGLNNSLLQSWLKNHYHELEEQISAIGKTHTVLKALNHKLDAIQNMMNLDVERHASIPVVNENADNKSAWLGNSEEKFQHLQKENNACKTEITIKRKRIVR
jgi:hypothetical protein